MAACFIGGSDEPIGHNTREAKGYGLLTLQGFRLRSGG
jgi:hypothetical protein